MKLLTKISESFGKYMAIIVLAVAALALFVPSSSLWIDTAWINYLLMIIMFGMGLTMKPRDFAPVFTRPKDILIGCAAQFIIMPSLAFGLSRLFGLDPALTAGVVLVGTCPGGTASNVITYLSKGDVALSVGMTGVNTLLAPLLTPAITYLLLQTTVKVDVWNMFWSIVTVILIPIALCHGHSDPDSTRFFDKYAFCKLCQQCDSRATSGIDPRDMFDSRFGRFAQCRKDFFGRSDRSGGRYSAQSVGISLRLRSRKAVQNGTVKNKGSFNRDRNAKLGLGNQPCRNCVSAAGNGNCSGRVILGLAQYLGSYSCRLLQKMEG